MRRRQGERPNVVCVQGTDGNVGPSVIGWAEFHKCGKVEMVVLDGTMNQQLYPENPKIKIALQRKRFPMNWPAVYIAVYHTHFFMSVASFCRYL